MLFFFQAEDGIRDGRVTGVQTCALPILPASTRCSRCAKRLRTASLNTKRAASMASVAPRSEERRVGKEGRTQRAPNSSKKKKAMIGVAVVLTTGTSLFHIAAHLRTNGPG